MIELPPRLNRFNLCNSNYQALVNTGHTSLARGFRSEAAFDRRETVLCWHGEPAAYAWKRRSKAAQDRPLLVLARDRRRSEVDEMDASACGARDRFICLSCMTRLPGQRGLHVQAGVWASDDDETAHGDPCTASALDNRDPDQYG
jgi:hypothetical protein